MPSIPVCGDAFHVYGETCATFILVYDLSMKKGDSLVNCVRSECEGMMNAFSFLYVVNTIILVCRDVFHL